MRRADRSHRDSHRISLRPVHSRLRAHVPACAYRLPTLEPAQSFRIHEQPCGPERPALFARDRSGRPVQGHQRLSASRRDRIQGECRLGGSGVFPRAAISGRVRHSRDSVAAAGWHRVDARCREEIFRPRRRAGPDTHAGSNPRAGRNGGDRRPAGVAVRRAGVAVGGGFIFRAHQ